MFVESSVFFLIHRGPLLHVLNVFVPSRIMNVILLNSSAKTKEFYRLLDEMQLQRIVKVKHEILL